MAHPASSHHRFSLVTPLTKEAETRSHYFKQPWARLSPEWFCYSRRKGKWILKENQQTQPHYSWIKRSLLCVISQLGITILVCCTFSRCYFSYQKENKKARQFSTISSIQEILDIALVLSHLLSPLILTRYCPHSGKLRFTALIWEMEVFKA